MVFFFLTESEMRILIALLCVYTKYEELPRVMGDHVPDFFLVNFRAVLSSQRGCQATSNSFLFGVQRREWRQTSHLTPGTKRQVSILPKCQTLPLTKHLMFIWKNQNHQMWRWNMDFIGQRWSWKMWPRVELTPPMSTKTELVWGLLTAGLLYCSEWNVERVWWL